MTARAVADFRVDQYSCDRVGDSPGLRQALTYPHLADGVIAGTRTASTISPGCSADSSAPVIKSSMARLRPLQGPAQRDLCPSAANAEIQSAAGSA